MAIILCPECGKEISEHAKTCIYCGYPLGHGEDEVKIMEANHTKATVDTVDKPAPKKSNIIVIVLAIVATIVVLGSLVLPKVFTSIETLCSQGNYEEAYKKATPEQKKEIAIENYAAVQSAVSANEMGTPSFFKLVDAYYFEEAAGNGGVTKYLTLLLSSNCHYSAIHDEYWLYIQGGKMDNWEFMCNVSNLQEEELSQYDDSSTIAEKIMNNMGRSLITTTMNKPDGVKLNSDSINRINAMFEAGTINKIELLHVAEEVAETDTSAQKNKKEKSIIGIWESKLDEITLRYEFTSDGAFHSTAFMSGVEVPGANGTYSVRNDEITIHIFSSDESIVSEFSITDGTLELSGRSWERVN